MFISVFSLLIPSRFIPGIYIPFTNVEFVSFLAAFNGKSAFPIVLPGDFISDDGSSDYLSEFIPDSSAACCSATIFCYSYFFFF